MSFTIPQPKALGLSQKEKRSYSLLNALGHIQKGQWDKLGLEGECSKAIQDRLGKAPQGIFVPTEVGWGQRDMTVGSATAGGNLVGTDHLGDRFVDALRAKSIIFELGAVDSWGTWRSLHSTPKQPPTGSLKTAHPPRAH